MNAYHRNLLFRWHVHASHRCVQLCLGDSGIGAAGAAVLADVLMANRTLWSLDLPDNSIGDVGAAALARALATNCSLEFVRSAYCNPQWLGDKFCGWPPLCPCIASLTCHSPVLVSQLDLGGNFIGD